MWQGKYIQIVYQNASWEGSIWYYCIDGCGEKFGNHFGENLEKKIIRSGITFVSRNLRWPKRDFP